MRTLIYLLTALSLNAFASEKNWHTPYCEKCEDKTISKEAFPTIVLTLGTVAKESGVLEKKVRSEVDHWKNFSKWLNSKSPNLSKKETSENLTQWKTLEEQGLALIEVNKLLGVSKRKLELCRINCSRSRLLELEDEVKKHTELEQALRKLSKWWNSEEFNDVIKKALENETFSLSRNDLKNVFTNSLQSFASGGKNLCDELREVQKIIDQGMKEGQSTDRIIDTLVMKHGHALDLVLKKGLREGRTELCSLANQKYAWDKSMATSGKALKFTLTAATMIPTGGASATAAPLVARGLSSISKLIPKSKLAQALPGVLLSGKLIQERIAIEDRCDNDLVSLKLGETEGDKWIQCLKDKKDSSLEAVLTLLPTVVGPTLPYAQKLLTKYQDSLPPRYGFAVTAKADGKHMTALDLSEKRLLQDKELAEVSGSYWEYVADTYKKRLNLSDDEIKSFLESSKQVESRTHLIVATQGPAKKKVFEGGVAMVGSSKAKDLLPLEKATGMRLPRDKGKIAEIVRLTSDDSPTLMKDLLKDMSKLTSMDKKLTTLYIYTSNIHLRLYRKMGIPHEVIAKPVERDVVIKVDVKEWQKVMAEI